MNDGFVKVWPILLIKNKFWPILSEE